MEAYMIVTIVIVTIALQNKKYDRKLETIFQQAELLSKIRNSITKWLLNFSKIITKIKVVLL